MKHDFISFNDSKKQDNFTKKEKDLLEKKNERFHFFPFTEGEKVEENRKELGV